MPDDVIELPSPRAGRSGGRRRAVRSSHRLVRRQRPPDGRRRGGRRRSARVQRRAHGLPGAIGLTVMSAFVPGSGYLYAGRRALGALVVCGWLAVIAGLLWYFGRDVRTALNFVFDPTLVRIAAVAMTVALLVWVFVVLTSHRLVRERQRPRSHTVVGWVTVAAVLVVGAAPVLRAAQYALVTASAVADKLPETVESATTPDVTTDAENPWEGQERVNVLLLGGDGGDGRTGIRTDTVILVSIDTVTGRAVTFSLPRNLMYAQFPEDSPLHDIYPDGYQTGQGDPGFDMLNAIYGQVPALHPGVLGRTDNEGADAVKQAVEGSLGIPVDYYLLVNLHGFQTVVDAVGGITVNVNRPVAINGDTTAGIPPSGWIAPGADQELDGFHALWFSRGRYGADDYERMDRQRCAVDALIDAADPATLLTRYLDIVSAGKEIFYTDISRDLAPAFVELLLKVKGADVRSVVFKPSDEFYSGDPDYDYVREVVAGALDPPQRSRSGGGSRTPSQGSGEPTETPSDEPSQDSDEPLQETVDVCAYQPTGETVEDAIAAAGGLSTAP